MATRVQRDRTNVVTVLGTVFLAFGLVWLTVSLLDNGDDGAGIANVLALPVSVLSLVVGTAGLVVGARLRPKADDPAVLAYWARALLKEVTTEAERALQQLLGDTGNPRPADVGFVQPEAAMLRWRTDGGAVGGSLETIGSYYNSLDLGRMVVLGEAGAGKTVLVLRLLLDLATTCTQAGTDPAAPARVPVRLSLPAVPVVERGAGAGVIRARLDTWIADHLTRVHGIKPAFAAALVTHGRILPILDGLDEMDPDDTPERARQVLAALNHAAGPSRWPIVLTCRTARYRELIRPTPDQSGGPLQDATVVLVQPLGVEQVIAWLAHRFPDPTQPDGLQQRWRRVATTLRKHPRGRLANCLTSPLFLYLATAVYRDTDINPRELCDFDPAALQQHLFRHVIPALARQYPRPDHTHYDPDRVRRWLQTLADHLARMTAMGYPSTDIHLDDLWRTTGHPPGRRIRYHATAFCTGLVALPPLGAMALYALAHSIQGQLGEWLIGLVLLLALGGFAYQINSQKGLAQRFDLSRLRTSVGRRKFASYVGRWSAVGLAFGLSIGLTDGRPVGLAVGLAVGLVFGPAFGLSVGLASTQQSAMQPGDPIRQACAVDIVTGLVFGLTVGLVSGLLLGLTDGLAVGLTVGLTVGLAGCLAIGFLDSVWPRYVLTVRSLSRTDQLPRQLGQFLDWAYIAGLVRLAGAATQFRHRDLQTHLTSTDDAPASTTQSDLKKSGTNTEI